MTEETRSDWAELEIDEAALDLGLDDLANGALRDWYLIARIDTLGQYLWIGVVRKARYQVYKHREDVVILDRFGSIEDARAAQNRLYAVYGEEVTRRLDGQAPRQVEAARSA